MLNPNIPVDNTYAPEDIPPEDTAKYQWIPDENEAAPENETNVTLGEPQANAFWQSQKAQDRPQTNASQEQALTSECRAAPCPWFLDEKGKVNELEFCAYFIERHPMKCMNGRFFTVDGAVEDENTLRKEIFELIAPYVSSGLPARVEKLLDTLRLAVYSNSVRTQSDRIHLKNGTLFLDGTFTCDKEYCLNRLPISYEERPLPPRRWMAFLNDLFYEEDIPTIQEFLGYCLIPSTKAQKMLIIIGKGGEGKSRLGVILRTLLGTNMNTGSIAKVEMSPFARADLENKLLLLDDDLKLEALPQTNYIKSLVTSELPMDLERKGKQSYQGKLYARFIALGNGTIQALYDKSYGFFRRQLIVMTKDRPKDRVDDPYIAEKIIGECPGILWWCFLGLERLKANKWNFTLSDRIKANLATAIRDGNNIVDFMEAKDYVDFDPSSEVASKDLYQVYRQWCLDNALYELSQKTFANYLIQHQEEYGIKYSLNVKIGAKRVRGFQGLVTMTIPASV